MKLFDLIKETEIKRIIGKDVDIIDLSADSNAVIKGSLFFCIKGEKFDGREFIRHVENYGAVAVITEEELETSLTQVLVDDVRKAMGEISAAFYGHCDRKMKIIGVLGTNGKTTTAHLITSVLTTAGIKCGLIGTLGTFYGDKYMEPTLTTPDPIELHKTICEMYKSGVEAVVMEVSAHAVYLRKIAGIKFEIGVFTNFTQDHLDFFKDMENYKRAKTAFFAQGACKYTVTNSDDPVGREIAKTVKEKVITYGIEEPSDVFAIDIKETVDGSCFIINLFDRIYEVKLNLIGRYNVYNALAAATASALYGIPVDKVVEGIDGLKGVSGRLECVYSGDFSVYVDYAHTPDGLYKSLSTLKKHAKNQLISVFGCGGNRDKSKRSVMGEISGKNADFTVLTSDNPRYEEPMDILWQIEEGIKRITENYVIVQDRGNAIEYALSIAKTGDIVLIAGKGSEKYQEIFGVKRPFDDKEFVKEFLRRNR